MNAKKIIIAAAAAVLLFLSFGCPNVDPPESSGPVIDVVTGASQNHTGNNTTPYSLGSLEQGSAPVTTSAEIRNIGDEDLVISSLAFTDATYYSVATPLSLPLTIAPSGSLPLEFSFNPVAQDDHLSAVRIVSNDSDNSPFLLNYTATVTPPSVIPAPQLEVAVTISGATSVLGNNAIQPLGSAQQGTAALAATVEIRNKGTAPLTVSNIVLSGDPLYSLESTYSFPDPELIDAGNSLIADILFGTDAIGTDKAATLTITSDDDTYPSFLVNFTASVTATPEPDIDVKDPEGISLENDGDPILLDTLIQGAPAGSAVIKIYNGGDAVLNVSDISFDSDTYYSVLSPTSFSLPAKSQVDVVVAVNPLDTGVLTGIMTIESNDTSDGEFIVNFETEVEEAEPELAVEVDGSVMTNNGAAYGFAAITPGDSSSASILLENNGTGDLVITDITVADETNFSLSLLPSLPATITPGSSISFQAILDGTTPNTYSSYINVTNNSSVSPFRINIAGTVNDPAAPAAPSNLSASALSGEAVKLVWNDNSGDEDHFLIEYSQASDFSGAESLEVAADSEEIKVLGLATDTTWYFRAAAVDNDGDVSTWTENNVTLDSSGEITLTVSWERETTLTASARYIYSIWLENPAESFYQNIFVCGRAFTRTSITGNNFSGETDDDIALDHWNRIVRQNFDDSEIDAVSAATDRTGIYPSYSEVLFSGHQTFTVYIEVDHSFDNNGNFGCNEQPPVIFKAEIDLSNPKNEYDLEYVGWVQLKHTSQVNPFPSDTSAGTLFIGPVTDSNGDTYTHDEIKAFITTADGMLISPKLTITR